MLTLNCKKQEYIIHFFNWYNKLIIKLIKNNKDILKRLQLKI